MGYKQRPTVRIDLSELGDNNGTPFFVEIKNPKLLTYDEKMKFALVAKDIKDANGNISINQDTVNSLKDVAKSYITAWNLIDCETEQPISPTTEDALSHVPSDVVEAIQKAIGGKSGQDEETKNSSKQLDKSSETDQLQEA